MKTEKHSPRSQNGTTAETAETAETVTDQDSGAKIVPTDQDSEPDLSPETLKVVALQALFRAAQSGPPAAQASAARTLLEALGYLGGARETLQNEARKPASKMDSAAIAAEIKRMKSQDTKRGA